MIRTQPAQIECPPLFELPLLANYNLETHGNCPVFWKVCLAFVWLVGFYLKYITWSISFHKPLPRTYSMFAS